MRIVDEDDPGAVGDGCCEHLEIRLKIRPQQRNGAQPRTGQRDGGSVRVVVRLEDDNLVIGGVDQREQRRRQSLGGAGSHDHRGLRVDLEPVEPMLMLTDRREQVGVSSPGRVLVQTLRDRIAGGLEHLDRTVFVRESLTEIDRPRSHRRRRHLCEDGRRNDAVTGEQARSRRSAPPGAGNSTHANQAKAIGSTHPAHTERTATRG